MFFGGEQLKYALELHPVHERWLFIAEIVADPQFVFIEEESICEYSYFDALEDQTESPLGEIDQHIR